MRLGELTAGLPVGGIPAREVEITGIAHDSRRVGAGELFVAIVGRRFDGRVFAPEAARRGAAAILAQGPAPAGIETPWLIAEDPRALLADLAARFYGHPDRDLALAGVTGTNGKSTVVALLAAIFEASGRPAGALGTLGYRFRDWSERAERTTPESSDLFRVLRAMRAAGAGAVAMEVSSHALALGRLAPARFDLAVFTNLTRDHFDFHRDFEDYFAAKRRLFEQLKPGGKAAVNAGDPYGRRLAASLPAALTFGPGGAVAPREAALDAAGIRGVLSTPGGDVPFTSPLLGRYNLDNLVAAAAGAEALGLPHAAIAAGLAACRPLPGRMEPVDMGQAFPALIDYAHTDAALEAALRSVKEFTRRKVILVFGCGGDRDPGKRALMGRAAGELAELPIVTSDNPRSEDPLLIIAAVEQGLRQSGNRDYRIVPDRREAIRRAVAIAGPEWAVLVAGKGHEQVQIIGERELPFSDREEVARALEDRPSAAARG